jgi:hypothetical protein
VISPEELIARAKADLAKQEAAEARALEAMERARAEQVKLRGFIETLERYSGIEATAVARPRAQGRVSRSRELVDKAVEILFFNDMPIEIGKLADLIEIEGLTIAGQNRNATLAGYLSRDERVEFVRPVGWQLTEAGRHYVHSSGRGKEPQNPVENDNEWDLEPEKSSEDFDDDIPF